MPQVPVCKRWNWGSDRGAWPLPGCPPTPCCIRMAAFCLSSTLDSSGVPGNLIHPSLPKGLALASVGDSSGKVITWGGDMGPEEDTCPSQGSEQARFSGCLTLDPWFHSAQPIFFHIENPNCRSICYDGLNIWCNLLGSRFSATRAQQLLVNQWIECYLSRF